MRIGNLAPDFKATTLNQKDIVLSQFKASSVVLLDFWASWCVPCRQSIPYLKVVYHKYHTKGLSRIAVSVDEDRKKWIDAVNQDSTNMWYHISPAAKWPKGPWTHSDIIQN
jgi:thiol-disulfide isomerase/thioredoxin